EQAGSSEPFLYTQSQAILARTWVPCQDSPGVRMTYDATIHAPQNLLAVMSAENPKEKNATGVYRFEMPQAIPSYLLALAVGDLEYRAFDGRSGVYALPSVAEAAAWELADTPKMIDAAEKALRPLPLGTLRPPDPPRELPVRRHGKPADHVRHADDPLGRPLARLARGPRARALLVGQPGDQRELERLLAQRRVHHLFRAPDHGGGLRPRVRGDEPGARDRGPRADRDAAGRTDEPDTKLELDLAGRDPDDGMNDIAYKKGALFLRLIEETVGRARWDEYLRSYFDRHAFQSMDTAACLADLRARLI